LTATAMETMFYADRYLFALEDYEMKLIILLALVSTVFNASIVLTLDAPDASISGLAFESGSLWAVDRGTSNVYELDPSNGSVQSSFFFAYGLPSGMAISGNTLYILRSDASINNGMVYKYSTAGSIQGSYDSTC